MKFKAVLLFFLLTTIPAMAQEMVAPTFERCQHIQVGEEMQGLFNRTLMEHVMTIEIPGRIGRRREGVYQNHL